MSRTVIFLTLTLLLAPQSTRLFYLEAKIKSLSACGYSRNHSLLLLSCPQARSAAVPAAVRVEPNVTLSPPTGASLTLENVTRVTVSPPQVSTVPVEIKRCGLSGLGLLPAVSEASRLLLNLSDLGLRLGDQGEFSGISRLVWLDLSNNRIASVPPDAFDDLSELLVLDLSHNLIDDLGNTTFCGLSSLRALDIRDNPLVMTFALLTLPALESLDTSMSVIEIGTFCRMNSLKRVVLHQPLDQLQCFVFDSVPSLIELNYSYYAGSNKICFTMMCDPHPVLNKRVPFNFTITQLNSDGSVLKVARNKYVSRFSSFSVYLKLCKSNYEKYLAHHNNNIPLTTGCLTPEGVPPPCQTVKPRTCPPLRIAETFSSGATFTSTPTSTVSLSTVSTPTVSASSVSALTATTSSVKPAVEFTTQNVESSATAVSKVFSKPIQTTVAERTAEDWSTTTEATDTDRPSIHDSALRDATQRRQRRRLAELEAEILHLERVIVVVYSINGVLLLGLLLLFGCCLRVRLLHRRDHQRSRGSARWPLNDSDGWMRRQPPQLDAQQPPDGTAEMPVALDKESTDEQQLTQQHQQQSQLKQQQQQHREDDGYTPMHDPVRYQRLPDAFPNLLYVQAGRDEF